MLSRTWALLSVIFVLGCTCLAAVPYAIREDRSSARPVSLATADFDEDGVADLVCGYTGDGESAIAISRGIARGETDLPYFGPATFVRVSVTPDFVGAGDFDADGHADIVVATRGGDALYFESGDGRGGTDHERVVDLNGSVTSLAVGEIDTMDGLEDIVVGVSTADGPSAVVFASALGALTAAPERVDLPVEASDLAIGQADAQFPLDIVATTGRDAYVIHGRARDGESGENERLAARSVTLADPSSDAVSVVLGKSARPSEGVIAQIPMMLNSDGLEDFALIEPGHTEPSFRVSQPFLNFVVNTLADSGAGSLRQAILNANGSGGADSISFTVAGTITLGSTLPALTDTVTIDATTAPGYTTTPVVEINGNSIASVGITVSATGCVVRGLAINRCATQGILISADNATIQSNFVGTNMAGTAALGNGSTGIQVNASNCTIGGSTATGNISSGNGVHGIAPAGGTSGNIVRGNLSGTDVTGNATIPNAGSGIDINNSINNTVGGPTAASRNIICGNFVNGITIFSNANGNVVQGNRIGVGAGGAILGNGNQGIRMHLANNCTIGGAAGGAGNIIDNNGGIGIVVLQATGDSIRGNEISNNAGLGIDLDQDGVTANDAGDGDANANNDQNYPVITSAIGATGSTFINGTLNSTPSSSFTIDYFGNVSCDPSGFGQGALYLGSTVATTDPAGNAAISFMAPQNLIGQSITATATDSAGDTSEFSACVGVTPAADLAIGVNAAPAPVPAGANFTVTVTVTNNGPAAATNPTWSMNPLAGTGFVSILTPPGWSSTTPPIGGSGTISCSAATLASGANAVFIVVVKVDPSLPDGSTIAIDVMTGSATPDPNLLNNDSVSAVLSTIAADLVVSMSGAPDPVAAGTDEVYTIQVVNSGPSDAQTISLTHATTPGTTFVSLAAPPGWSCTTPAPGAAGSVSCTIPALPAGGSGLFTLTLHIDQTAVLGSTITATASVSATSPDPVAANDTSVVVTTVGNLADLGVSVTAAPSPILPGQDLTYTIVVTNAGPSDAANVMLTSVTPANTTFASATAPAGWACVTPPPFVPGTIVCSTPGLTVGSSATITLAVRVDSLLPAGTSINYAVTATSDGSDPSPGDDTATATTLTTAPPSADIQLAGTVSSPTTAPGGTIVFTLTATNAGPDPVSSLTITDPLPPGTTFVSVAPDTDGTATAPPVGETGVVTTSWASPTLPGQSHTTTIVVQVNADTVNGYVITNVATAAGSLADPDGSNNVSTTTATVEIDATQAFSDIGVSIGELPLTVDTGTLLQYDVTVTNNGPDACELVRLTGSTPNGTRFVSLTSEQGTITAPAPGSTGSFTCDIGTLSDGQSVNVTLTANVIAEGGTSVTARFVAGGSSIDSVPFNNSAATITNVQAGNDTFLAWDPPLDCSDDCLNPPLHLQTSAPPPSADSSIPRASQFFGGVPKVARDPRNSLVGYNIYRSNSPNVAATPANFFTSVPPSTTGIIAPTATTGSFFTVTAQYPNGESSDTNAASGGIPEPDITVFEIRAGKVLVGGTGFSDTVQVFVDGIPFKKGAKVKPGNVRIVQKGRLLTGQSVAQYLNQQGGVVLVSVLNSDTGIGTFLYRSP